MEATFLTQQQIWVDHLGNSQLQVMKEYGTKTGMSDLAIALGGYMGRGQTSDGQRTGYVWSASSKGNQDVRAVRYDGDRDYYGPSRRNVGARPALPSSVTSSIRPNEVRPTREISGVQIVEFGEYPQTIAPEGTNTALEQAYNAGRLQTTGKKYTFDSEKYNAYDKPFNAKEYAEYQHNGKRYIRLEAETIDCDSVMSNGRKPENGEACWIEVQPIEWLQDPSGTWVARQALFAGVQFDSKPEYDGNFADTDIKQYLDRYFSKEMVAGRDVDAPEVVGPTTAAITVQRQRALTNRSQGI